MARELFYTELAKEAGLKRVTGKGSRGAFWNRGEVSDIPNTPTLMNKARSGKGRELGAQTNSTSYNRKDEPWLKKGPNGKYSVNKTGAHKNLGLRAKMALSKEAGIGDILRRIGSKAMAPVKSIGRRLDRIAYNTQRLQTKTIDQVDEFGEVMMKGDKVVKTTVPGMTPLNAGIAGGIEDAARGAVGLPGQAMKGLGNQLLENPQLLNRANIDDAGLMVGREARETIDRWNAIQGAMHQASGRLHPANQKVLQDLAKSFSLKDKRSISTAAMGAIPFITAGAAVPAAQHVYQQAQISNSKDRMMTLYPELQEADPDAIDRAFDVIRTYAPSIARSPVAAGAIASKFTQFDAIDPQQIQLLLNMEEKSQKLSPSTTMPQMVSSHMMGMAATGG